MRTNSDLCHLHHKLIGFITELKSVYCEVRTGALNRAVFHSSLKRVKNYDTSIWEITFYFECSESPDALFFI